MSNIPYSDLTGEILPTQVSRRLFSHPAAGALRNPGVLAALAMMAVTMVAGVQLRPLLAIDEPRYLAVAWEMHLHGDWLVPHLNGLPYREKGPLLFWLINMAWSLFGVSELVARLVPAAFSVAAVALTAILGQRLWPDRDDIPGHAALMLAGTAVFALFSTLVMFDALLTACVLVGMHGIVSAWRRRGVAGWSLFAAGLGLGVLTKGPVVAVYLLPAALMAPVWMREQRSASWRAWYGGAALGVLAGALAALAWALPAAAAAGREFGQSIFWDQYVNRILGSGEHAHGRPVWFYLALLPAVLFPWIVWPPLLQAVRPLMRAADDPLRMLAICAAGSLLVLSLVAGKQVHYLLPVLPVLALAAARALSDRPARAATTMLPAVIAGAASVGCMALACWGKLGHELPASVAAIPLWAGPALLVLAAGFALGARALPATAAVAAACPAVLLVGQLAARPTFELYDLGELARSIHALAPPALASLGPYQGEVTFQGRLTERVDTLGDLAAAAGWATANPGGIVLAAAEGGDVPAGLREIYRRPFRSRTLRVWFAPGPDCRAEPGKARAGGGGVAAPASPTTVALTIGILDACAKAR